MYDLGESRNRSTQSESMDKGTEVKRACGTLDLDSTEVTLTLALMHSLDTWDLSGTEVLGWVLPVATKRILLMWKTSNASLHNGLHSESTELYGIARSHGDTVSHSQWAALSYSQISSSEMKVAVAHCPPLLLSAYSGL